MIFSRVNALKATVNRHSDEIGKMLLGTKIALDKRTQFESAFRACKEAFLEVSAVLINIIEERASMTSTNLSVEDIKKVVVEALNERDQQDKPKEKGNCGGCGGKTTGNSGVGGGTFASVAGSPRPEVRVSHGPTVEIIDTASFLIMPKENMRDKYSSSKITRETLCRVFKPADCALKIRRLTNAREGGVRIEAYSPDMEKVKAHPALAEAGLEVRENKKLNPRIIVHGVPKEMSADEIRSEPIAQNLDEDLGRDLRTIYIFKPKENKQTVSCILELQSAARKMLLRNGRIYLRYASCTFADHVRVVQCYRCLNFGHIAGDCKYEPSWCHCAGAHEMKDCTRKERQLKCSNCVRQNISQGDTRHSATDAASCPILGRKIKDRIAYINYD